MFAVIILTVTVIGVNEDTLWFHQDGDAGASYWGGKSGYQSIYELYSRLKTVCLSNTNDRWAMTQIPLYTYNEVYGLGLDNTGNIFYGHSEYISSFHPREINCIETIRPLYFVEIYGLFGLDDENLVKQQKVSENYSLVFSGDFLFVVNDRKRIGCVFRKIGRWLKAIGLKGVRPCGIAVAVDGTLIVTEKNAIKNFKMESQKSTTIAGSESESGYKDGEAKEARFNNPTGVVVSKDGTIYICDTGNSCLRKIKDGMVSTVAGSPLKEVPACSHDGPLDQVCFEEPRFISLDIDGSLIVSDSFGRNILLKRINLKQNLVSVFQNVHSDVFTVDKEGNIFVYTKDPSLVNTRSIIRLHNTWRTERFLWIGNKKEKSSDCWLASLPKEIIREIVMFYREACKLKANRVTITSQE